MVARGISCEQARRFRMYRDDVDEGGLAGALQTQHGELHLLGPEEATAAHHNSRRESTEARSGCAANS